MYLSFQKAQTVNTSNSDLRCSKFPIEHSGPGDMNSVTMVILRAPCPNESTNPKEFPGIP